MGVVRDVKFLQNKRGREVFLFVRVCVSVPRFCESWLRSVEKEGGSESVLLCVNLVSSLSIVSVPHCLL